MMTPIRTYLLLAACALPLLCATPALGQSQSYYVVQSGDTLYRVARSNGLTVDELKALNGITDDVIRVGQQLLIDPDGTPPDMIVEPIPEEPPDDLPDEPIAPIDDPYADAPADVGPSIEPAEDRPVVLDTPAPIPAGPPPPPPPPATITRVAIGGPNAGQVVGGGPAPSAEASQVHVVQRGETLFTISRIYGTTVGAIRALNGLSGDLISVGQELRVGGRAAPVVIQRPVRRTAYNIERSTVPDDRVHVVRPGETLFSVAVRYGVSVRDLLALNTLSSAPLAPGTPLTLPEAATPYYREPAPLPEPEETGLALVYPDSYEGRETISGEPYNPTVLSASHRTYAFGTILHVTLPATGKSTLVRINDRGPVSEGFLIELSEAAARALGQNRGAAEEVEVRVVR